MITIMMDTIIAVTTDTIVIGITDMMVIGITNLTTTLITGTDAVATTTGPGDKKESWIKICILHMLILKGWCTMKDEIKTTPNGKPAAVYDDGNIPDVDLPNGENSIKPAEPLPESSRPRKDGPGGD